MEGKSLWGKLEKILPEVERPSRYIGREWGTISKGLKKAKVKVALAYPDLYEVGMSNLGLSILYHLLQSKEDILVERVYAPAEDLEKLMRKVNIPLFSLGNHLPVKSFDIFGFSLQTEMTYTNVLNMLDLAGIPLYAKERDGSYPLIIGGGPCVFNAEPLASFFDLFVLGEGEEVILELVEEYKRSQKSEVRSQKERLLKSLMRIAGVYVPSFYEVKYDDEGKVKRVEPKAKEAPPVVLKRVIKDLDKAGVPPPVVPYFDTIHNRASLEIMRGCTRGCRFCQAGIIYRPSRERSIETLLKKASKLLKESGYSELSLSSLSSSDYSGISSLIQNLSQNLIANSISLSLPSLRMDTFSVDLVREIAKVKKTGLTFAPEAGTERLRRIINKELSEEVLLNTVRSVFEAGWERLKLYFLIGLPYETQEDLEGIVELAQKITRIALGEVPPKRRAALKITFNVSPFVPKAHSPFQWVAQDSVFEFQEKIDYLRKNLRKRPIIFKVHDPKQALIEGALARGDRRLSRVIKKAWEKGAKFEAWKENFDFARWERVFQEEGLSLDFYTRRVRSFKETLPWDHLSSGTTKEFLWEEFERAQREELTPDCRQNFPPAPSRWSGGRAGCPNCGACPELEIPPPPPEARKHQIPSPADEIFAGQAPMTNE